MQVMGGRDSAYFQEYLRLCVEAFLEARRHSEAVITLMDIMFYESNFPAFKYVACRTM
jgi:dihydrodipicolinate synthase/N-acetylneuraminate lyase